MDGRDYAVFFKRLLLALILFFSTRIFFALFNLDYFTNVTLLEMAQALGLGLRFDVATTLIVNIPFIIFSIIPIVHPFYEIIKQILFVVFNFTFLFLNVVDMKFFPFIGKKMTIHIFKMGSDITDQTTQIIQNYWYMGILLIPYLILLIKGYAKKKESIMYIPKLSWLKIFGIGFGILVVTAIGIRGGVQMRSLSPKQAFVFDKYELGNMTLNPSYTILRSIGKKEVGTVKYFPTDNEAIAKIKTNRTFQDSELSKKNQNVVIIILESFSQEYIEKGLAPNFVDLAKKGLYFEHNFANGRRSLEALPSILTGIPSLLDRPLYQTTYQANQYFGLPQILKNNGYSTSFFHGGKKGTMDFDAYCESIGVDQYFAKEDYPNQKHYDGHWGIYDHYYLSYFADEIDKLKKPFFTSVFTLSSHQPYSIPRDYASTILKGTLEIHKSIKYVDIALKEFFTKVATRPWFKETLFVITADHTQKLETKKFMNDLGSYRVPLLFYHPEINLAEYSQKSISQHADIMPTVLDFLGIEFKQKLYFGSSLFNQDPGRMINHLGGRYFYLAPPYYLTFTNNQVSYFRLDAESNTLSNIEVNTEVEEYLLELKAYIQYLNNGLKNNNLYRLGKDN